MIVDGSEQQIKIFRNDRYFERSTHPGKKSKHTFRVIVDVTPRKGRLSFFVIKTQLSLLREKLDVILRNQVQKQTYYATTTEIDPT